MSSESREAVLNSLRYKSEHLPSEVIYVSLIAYLLYMRTPSDIEKYTLPYFLFMVVAYQIAGVISQLISRRMPDFWDIVYWTFSTTIFSASYVLIAYGIIALGFDTWEWLKVFWLVLDPLANQTQFIVVTGLMTISVGALFFWFRLKQRFLYGLSEVLVGVGVGMHRVTLEQWSGVPESTGFYIALLTAGIYLVVRGLDNMHQAQRNGDPMLHRVIRLFRKPLPSKVKPPHLSRFRRTLIRKLKR